MSFFFFMERDFLCDVAFGAIELIFRILEL